MLFERQIDFFNPILFRDRITIIGCGGIGSSTAFILSKIGVRIKIFDSDTVEEHNLSNQLPFHEGHLGLFKVEALRMALGEPFSGLLTCIPEKYEGQEIDDDLIILAVDSMEARRQIISSLEGRDLTIINAGMGLLEYSISVCRIPVELEELMKSVRFEANLPCTARAVLFNAAKIGALIAQIVISLLRREPVPKKIFSKGFDQTVIW